MVEKDCLWKDTILLKEDFNGVFSIFSNTPFFLFDEVRRVLVL